MRNLILYPTFGCKIDCVTCPYKTEINEPKLFSLTKLEMFLMEYSKQFDKIIISGANPFNINKNFFDNLITLLQKFNANIVVEGYPVTLTNYRPDVEYNLTFDFYGRPYGNEVWSNLVDFKKPFDISLIITTFLTQIKPDDVLKKLSMIPNLKSVDIKYGDKLIQGNYNITNSQGNSFIKTLLKSDVNYPFRFNNITVLNNILLNKNIKKDENYYINPYNQFGIYDYDELNLRTFKEISPEMIGEVSINYPTEYELYTKELINWWEQNI